MTMLLPCVTTPLANQALLATPDRDILLAQTANEFQIQIQRLLQQEDLYRLLQSNGQHFVQNHFSWERESQRWLSLISSR